MKKVLIIPFLFLLSLVFSQKYEVGMFVGGANAISDIGGTNYIDIMPKNFPNIPVVVGGIYRYNLNPQQGLRFNLSYASIIGDNKLAVDDYRKYRKSRYSNSILEFSTVFEYNFFPINGEQQTAHSPYIFGGVGVYAANKPYYNVYYYSKAGKLKDFTGIYEGDLSIGYSLPFGIGYKYRFNWNWVVSAEVGFRPTFVDYLDLSSIKGDKHFTISNKGNDLEKIKKDFELTDEQLNAKSEDIIKDIQIGDNSKNDWYVFTGITLSYSFGRPPCFCD